MRVDERIGRLTLNTFGLLDPPVHAALPVSLRAAISQPGTMLGATKPGVCAILNIVLPSFQPGALGKLLASQIKRQVLADDPACPVCAPYVQVAYPLMEGGIYQQVSAGFESP